MRTSFVTRFGVGLLVGSVGASPCKPHSTTATTVATSAASSSFRAADASSSTIIPSVEIQVSSTTLGLDIIETTTAAEDTATTTVVENESTTTVTKTSKAATSDVPTTTTSETVISVVTATETSEATTAADTATTLDVEDTTTTELTITLEVTTSAAPTATTSEAVTTTMTSDLTSLAITTTTSEATISTVPTTTTSEATWPLETFALISSPESGPLMGSVDLYQDTYFGADKRWYTPLTLTIEPGTNRLRLAGGRYLCTSWGVLEWPGAILTCDIENSEVKYIECTQANNGELSCRGKAAQCGMGAGGLTCSSNGDYVSQFLVQQQEDGYRLFLAYGPSDEFSSVTLKAAQAETQ